MDMMVVLQGLTVAVLVWFGSRVVAVSERVAVHDEKHETTEKRLAKLESQPCPYHHKT